MRTCGNESPTVCSRPHWVRAFDNIILSMNRGRRGAESSQKNPSDTQQEINTRIHTLIEWLRPNTQSDVSVNSRSSLLQHENSNESASWGKERKLGWKRDFCHHLLIPHVFQNCMTFQAITMVNGAFKLQKGWESIAKSSYDSWPFCMFAYTLKNMIRMKWQHLKCMLQKHFD